MKRSILSFISVGLLYSPQLLADEALSFEQAWGILQKQNNSLAAQRANVDRYTSMQNASANLNLPKVTLGANYSYLDDDITLSGEQLFESTGETLTYSPVLAPLIEPILQDLSAITSTLSDRNVFSTSIRAIWPIYTGGRITAAKSASEAKKQEAESHLAMESQARFEELSQYYFSVLLAKNVVQTRLSVEQGLAQHRDNAIKLEQQGQLARVERLQAEASLDKAKVERKKVQKSLVIAESALTQILNQKTKVELNGFLFINTRLPALTYFTEKTLSSYPGLDLLRAKENQANSLISLEKGKYQPEVFLYGDYQLYEKESLATELTPDWFVGVGVNIALIESSGRGDQVKAAHSAVSQLKFLRAQAKQDLTVLVHKTYLEAEQSIEEVKGLNSSLQLAQENKRLRLKAFSQGLSTSIDVVDAELYLAGIRSQQALASFHYLLSLTKLLALSNQMDSFSIYQSSAMSLRFLNSKGEL